MLSLFGGRLVLPMCVCDVTSFLFHNLQNSADVLNLILCCPLFTSTPRRKVISGVKLGVDDDGLDVAVIQEDVKHEEGVRDFVPLRPCEESGFAEAANSQCLEAWSCMAGAEWWIQHGLGLLSGVCLRLVTGEASIPILIQDVQVRAASSGHVSGHCCLGFHTHAACCVLNLAYLALLHTARGSALILHGCPVYLSLQVVALCLLLLGH